MEKHSDEKNAPGNPGKIIAAAAAVIAVSAVLLNMVVLPGMNYHDALSLMEAGQYEAAIAAFEALEGWRDSAEKIEDCRTGIKDNAYDAALSLMEDGQYAEAIAAFEVLGGLAGQCGKNRRLPHRNQG